MNAKSQKTKQMMSQQTLLVTRLCVAVLTVIVTLGLMIAGFVVNPTGEIHTSLLVGFGLAGTFSAGLLGVKINLQNTNY